METRLSRRLLVLRLAALGGTGTALAGCVTPVPGYYGVPGPVAVRGTGITDADPSDGPGYGRGGYRGVSGRTGITDSDPSDGPGRGRGGYRRIGRTDSDPRDPPGRGRW